MRKLILLAALSLCSTAIAQTAESFAARAIDDPNASAAQLRSILFRMPKGADLHVHLTGAIYAENILDEAAKDGLCVDTVALAFDKTCSEPGHDTLQHALQGQALRDALINSFSMRSFVPTSGRSGHDHFFATFDKFHGLPDFADPRWVDEVASRAAAQNENYVEIMHTPTLGRALALAKHVKWSDDASAMRAQIKPADLHSAIAADVDEFQNLEDDRQDREHCTAAKNVTPAPACTVTVRYLFQVLRAFTPEQVFAQTLLAFEVSKASHLVVGLNFVQAEDMDAAMQQYSAQMKMIGQLHALYPGVHISLHAGELNLGLVPPEGLRFHIREAVDVAHAERIGHGVDLPYEDGSAALLQRMAAQHISVEINLTSNDVILGVRGKQHPLALYRAAHVPFTLSTDDEGVSRIDLTNEYVRAVLEQGLTYRDLKTAARASLEHSFLPGESLWPSQDNFAAPRTVCAALSATLPAPSGSPCGVFLSHNEKAAAQYELERRLRDFEASFAEEKNAQ